MTSPGRTSRFAAVCEVVLVFALMHVAFRAIKRFTTFGQWETATGMNFSPGLVMIVVAGAVILLRGRGWRASGITLRPFGACLDAALLCLMLLGAGGGILLALGVPLRHEAQSFPAPLVIALASLALTALLAWLLARDAQPVERGPRFVTLVLLAGAALVPLVAAIGRGHDVGSTLLTTLWILIGAGLGEELFFRGYVQSRLNEAFGRPWILFGVPFGVGLFGATALFGLVHVLNVTDYFSGTWRFAWWHGLTTAMTLWYGFLRERTGSILAPAVVHGWSDLLGRMPRFLSGV